MKGQNLDQIKSTSAANADQNILAEKARPRVAANADFETFLTLLTAQLKNQDPLNPAEGTEFAVQLATFSNVEQQTRTNQLLTQMLEDSTGFGTSASLIGKETQTTAPVGFADTPLRLDIAPVFGADDVRLLTLDAQGTVVASEMIGPGSGRTDWFGRTPLGDKLPDGQYRFRIESLGRGRIIGASDVPVIVTIDGVKSGAEGPEVLFENGGSAKLSDIDMLRRPG